jgi:hypothetical protein
MQKIISVSSFAASLGNSFGEPGYSLSFSGPIPMSPEIARPIHGFGEHDTQ